MKDIGRIVQRHFDVNRVLYTVYSITTILFLLVIYLFFHKDLASSNDVVVVLDIGFIAFYQLLTLPILAFIVVRKNVLQELKNTLVKRRLFGAVSLLIPIVMVIVFPLFYYVVN